MSAIREHLLDHPDLDRPEHFTRANLGWVPWFEPPAQEELTPEQIAGLVEPQRAGNAYFRLLALDPAVLEARTRADLDIFHTASRTGDGLPRPERELAAAVASRVNGCVFCASVHARFAATLSKRPEDVDALLVDGVEVAVERLDERWAAIVEAAAALTVTPPRFASAHVERLRAAGVGDEAIGDLVASAGFFSWANRLMLSLGEPENPAG
ncbi:alkylhydroperoxidase domain protein [Litorihabitans aurantiacus]|uniref:Alkyl hydroperoxide reductase AhpD n=1 Tax=Litorihabitans aurantiacus TaxID=1930061 RepID=A0AA37UUM1_9MICO|nr:alkylhydroperoxidase domain protein [Litorihabitans aurantiacus]GMA30822.1 alkyl hydroperoxide reductase AhpD [Litorihabitans aurantiacus]